jgi:hypothetical protein
MPRNSQRISKATAIDIPGHPIISETLHRDTLDRVAHVIELLEQLDLTEGLTPRARTGLYWIHSMLADAIKHVSDAMQEPESRRSKNQSKRK